MYAGLFLGPPLETGVDGPGRDVGAGAASDAMGGDAACGKGEDVAARGAGGDDRDGGEDDGGGAEEGDELGGDADVEEDTDMDGDAS